MKNKLSKGFSLSANPKHLIKGTFSAVQRVFAGFGRKNNTYVNNKHSTKLAGGTKPTPSVPVILGPVPRILLQQITNPANKFALLLHKCRFAQDTRDKPENDGCWSVGCFSMSHSFNVIRGYRPANLDYRNKSGNDSIVEGTDIKHKTNILLKGCDVVRQYAVLFKRCVQSSTRARKFLADGVQCGRSMIEMLGVLAIIGVLSIGGIAGYSKAMTKYKVNKTINEITTIISNIKMLYINEKTVSTPNNRGYFDYEVENDEFDFLRNFIMPKETDTGVKNKYGGNMFQHPFGGEIYLELDDTSTIIRLDNLSHEACVAFGSYDWKDAKGIAISKLSDGDSFMEMMNCSAAGKSETTSTNENGLVGRCLYFENETIPMSPDLAAKGCSCPENTCEFSILFL